MDQAGASYVKYLEIDDSQYAAAINNCTAAAVVITKKGPIGEKEYCGTWKEFNQKYGGLYDGHVGVRVIKQLLNFGVGMYICRAAHYTDITDASTLTALHSKLVLKDRGGTPVDTLEIQAKTPGKWGDSLSIQVIEGTVSGSFTLVVYENDEEKEKHEDLNLDSTSEQYVEKVNQRSDFICIEDLMAETSSPGNIPGILAKTALSGGNDGLLGLTDIDFIGDQGTGTGFHAFNTTSEPLALIAPDSDSADVARAGMGYCEQRKDMVFIANTPFGLTPQELVDWRNGEGDYSHLSLDSSFGSASAGWIQILSESGEKTYIPNVGQKIIAMRNNIQERKFWFPPAGPQFGKLTSDVVGLEMDLGGSMNANYRDLLYNHGINPLVKEPEGNYIDGNKNLQLIVSSRNRENVRLLSIYLVRVLLPLFRAITKYQFIGEPLYAMVRRKVDPVLRQMERDNAFYKDSKHAPYLLLCGEEINPPEDIQQHKYRTMILYRPGKTAEYITVAGLLTSTTTNFEEYVTPI